MGEFVIGRKVQILAWIVAGIILSLNVKLIVDQISAWIAEAGDKAWLIEITVVPLTVGLGLLLLYVMVEPWLRRQNGLRIGSVHRQAPLNDAKIQRPAPYKRIAVALDFSGKDEKLLAESLRFVDKAKTKLTLLHVVESPVARRLGTEGEDSETLADRERLEALSQMMREHQVETDWQIGSGEPASELAKMINESNIEMVLVGGHGHSGVSDLIHGTVISDLRHHIKANVMIVPISD